MTQLFTAVYRPVYRILTPFEQIPRISSSRISALQQSIVQRNMATVKDSIPHIVRTAQDQRQQGFYAATIGRIEQINSTIRLFRLYIDADQPSLRHLPGQYVDLHIPEVERVGGFTITSPPQTALRLPAPTPSTTTPPSAATFDDPYIELAIQESPSNPPAEYMWRPQSDIMNAPVRFRIGGNFTYPPSTLSRAAFEKIDNVVLIAGGVGINPIISMISAMNTLGVGRVGGIPKRLRILYSSKRGAATNGQNQEVLFEGRIRAIMAKWADRAKDADLQYSFFDTSKDSQQSGSPDNSLLPENTHIFGRRIQHDDLSKALGLEDQRRNALVYVCGLPDMTDDFVEYLTKMPGMDETRVLCEKWW